MKEESLSSLTPGVHLIIVCPIRESRAFRDESLHPRLQHGMRQVPVSRFELGTGCCGARLLAAFRVHFNEATNFVAKGLDHRGSVRLILYEFGLRVRPLGAEPPHRQQRFGKIQPIAKLI